MFSIHAKMQGFSDEFFFLALYAEIQDDSKKWQEKNSEKSDQLTLQIPWGSKILSKSVYLAPFQR